MKTLCKFSCDYIAVLKNGEMITVPNVERELIFHMDVKHEETIFSPESSDKIQRAIEAVYPDYFKKVKK